MRKIVAMLALGMSLAACADNAEDHAQEAADDRVDAVEEMREGDTAEARDEMQDAAQHDSAAARDLQQGDTTELIN